MIDFTCRVAYFFPNPTVDWRIPFAAFVELGGACFIAVAKLLPDARYLGSAERSVLLQHAIREIEIDPWRHRGSLLSQALGPHFSIGETMRITASTSAPVQWVRDTILPH